ncbi:hypothetical protein ACSSS7_004273 [Eimeria intestinalis]
MAEGNRSLVNALIDQLKLQSAARPAAPETIKNLGEGKHVLLTCKSVAFPIFSFSTFLREEERIFLRGVQFREDDIVLLRPADSHSFTEEESWGVQPFLQIVELSHWEEFMMNGISFKVILRHILQKPPPPYVFAPEIRYLILHTSESLAEQVASRGPVPQLNDTDPEQYNPLHQLDELADGDSCKKQRVQPTLLQQVVRLHQLSSLHGSGQSLPDFLGALEFLSKVLCTVFVSSADNLMEGLSLRGIRTVRFGSGSESDLKEESIQGILLLYMRTCFWGASCRLSAFQVDSSATLRVFVFCGRFLLAHRSPSIRGVLAAPRDQASRGEKNSVIIATCVGSGHEMFDEVVFERVIIDECAQSIDVDDCNRPPVAGFLWPSPHSRVCLIDISAGLANMEQSLGTSKYSLVEIDPILAILRSVLQCGTIRPAEIGILTPYDAQKARIRFALNDAFVRLNALSYSQLAALPEASICSAATPVKRCGLNYFPPMLGRKSQMADIRNAVLVETSIFVLPCFLFPQDKALSYQIDVDSVDGFQGKEKDLIIFSAVRSNPRGEIGFLKDARRMNVMLTRARRGVLVVGDQMSLCYNPVSTGVTRTAGSSSVSGGPTAGNTGGGALKTAYMPQGFQADFGSGGSACRDDAREVVPEPMHEEEEVPEDWEQHL